MHKRLLPIVGTVCQRAVPTPTPLPSFIPSCPSCPSRMTHTTIATRADFDFALCEGPCRPVRLPSPACCCLVKPVIWTARAANQFVRPPAALPSFPGPPNPIRIFPGQTRGLKASVSGYGVRSRVSQSPRPMSRRSEPKLGWHCCRQDMLSFASSAPGLRPRPTISQALLLCLPRPAFVFATAQPTCSQHGVELRKVLVA